MIVLMRAFVMLTVLVGLPAAWVYYGPLPPGAQRVVDRVVCVAKSAVGWEQQDETMGDLKSAPRYDFSTETAAAYQSENSIAAQPLAATVPTASTDASQDVSQQAEPLLAQLRTLGAAEYTLEKWGIDGQLFRFCCAMPLAQSDEHTRQFEAVTGDPLSSIEQVIGEVTSWHLARHNGRIKP